MSIKCEKRKKKHINYSHFMTKLARFALTLMVLNERIECEIFSAIILNDGWINDWIRPCHSRLSALALWP